MIGLESLESRRLCAASSVTAAGTLLVEGTSADETIVIGRDGPNFTVTVDGEQTFTAAASSVKRLAVYAAAGNDRVELNKNVDRRTYIEGGSGDDTLVTRNTRSTLHGNAGRDRLRSVPVYDDTNTEQKSRRSSFNVLSGGSGNDAIIISSDNELALGGDGNDSLTVLPVLAKLFTETGDDFRWNAATAVDIEQIVLTNGEDAPRLLSPLA